MADAVQLASALTSLIGATCVVVEYVKKLAESRKSARDLYDRICDLERLLNSIRPVVECVEQSSSQSIVNDHTMRLKEGVQGCLEGCKRSIDEINKRLSGFADGKKGSLSVRMGFVSEEGEIKAHKDTIEGHIQSLQLSLIALNCLNDSVNHSTTHQFLQELSQVLAYLIVTQQQYQPHPASMGLRSRHARAPQSSLPNNRADIRMLPSFEEPEQNLAFYFSPVAWNLREPLPITRASPCPDSTLNNRVEEVSMDDADADNQAGTFPSDAVIDAQLAIAVKHNQPANLQALIAGGQDITGTDAEGWTLIHHAVYERAFDALQVLLQNTQGQSPNLADAQNAKQHTALMLCVRRAEHSSSLELAKALIEHGADVNVEDGNGRTALHLLVEFVANDNREAFAEVLVNNGATFGSQCRRPPPRAEDYEAVRNLANQLRRSSSAASAAAVLSTSPDSPTSSSGDNRRRSKAFSITAIRRRFSGDPGSVGA